MKDRFGDFDERERELLARAIDTEFRRKQSVYVDMSLEFPRLAPSDIGLDVLENLWLEIRGEL